jgi:hypothetical protein
MKKSSLFEELPGDIKIKERRQPTEKHGRIYLTFTDLYEIKQTGLEDLLIEHGEAFILSKRVPPIKVSLAEIK